METCVNLSFQAASGVFLMLIWVRVKIYAAAVRITLA